MHTNTEDKFEDVKQIAKFAKQKILDQEIIIKKIQTSLTEIPALQKRITK